MHPRRALLYMPGDDRHKIEKALTLEVDCICMDMEDGVALDRKAAARQTIVAALCELHGVQELWTADRDFSRFTFLKVVTLADEPAG